MSAGVRRGRSPGGRRGRTPSGDPGGEWFVCLPAWGERCVRVLTDATLPALQCALRGVSRSVTLRVYTDQRDRVMDTFLALEMVHQAAMELLPIPGPDLGFESMSRCHRDTLECGKNDRVLLLTADMVVSREVVQTCDALLSSGMQLVCCVAPRALQDAPALPPGASGRDLLAWAWDNRHPMTRECTWPEGKSYDVWRMYFEQDGEVAARVFLPHPLAVMPRGRVPSFRPTIDVNLASSYSPAVTRMITSPEEGAVVELSPPDKEFLTTESMSWRMLTGGPSCPPFVPCVNERHRYFFGRRVVIRGSGGDCGDAEVMRRMLG